jgi:hypothetical protein
VIYIWLDRLATRSAKPHAAAAGAVVDAGPGAGLESATT